MKIDKEKIKQLLSRNVQEIVDYQHLEKRLLSGKKLRIKYGVDVTSPMLHLGHGVNLWKMRAFQELGHKVVFLIGDFTTRIGDPTGKSIVRPQMSKKQIEKDAAEYKKQVSKILLTNSSVFEERRNSEWYDKMKLNEFFQLLSKITHAQLIQRDMFQERIKKEQEIYVHELLYPILQGYDSVMLKSDLTIIGQDQLFNELIGRDYQKVFNQAPQSIITTIITPGIDGKEKQSKSLGNYIAILDTPKDKYGKIMSIPDNLIISYFKVYTKLLSSEIKKFEKQLKQGINPRDLKARLGFEIVKLYHGEKAADKAGEEFNRIFRDKKLPENIPVYKINKERFKLMDILVETKLTVSRGEARRLIEQG
ncbi:tyrosine--tRNA ligase, partial [Patescibacteria group bacterium]|nr:tyrosine--tRNA ligase [Patescibacteria group bacterium]